MVGNEPTYTWWLSFVIVDEHGFERCVYLDAFGRYCERDESQLIGTIQEANEAVEARLDLFEELRPWGAEVQRVILERRG